MVRPERRELAGYHQSAACLKMLNDIKIEDRLRTDANSLDVLIGESKFFLFCMQSRCGFLSTPRIRFGTQRHSFYVWQIVNLI